MKPVGIAVTTSTHERDLPVDTDSFAAACRLFLHERYDEAIALARGLIAEACRAARGAAAQPARSGATRTPSPAELAALRAHHFDGTDDHSEYWITTLVTTEPRDGRIAGVQPSVRHTALLLLESLYLTRSYDACLSYADEMVAAGWVSADHPQLVITRAWVDNRVGRYEEAGRQAKTVLAQAREISPSTHASALHVRAMSEKSLGNIPVAHESMRDAVALHRAANNRAGLAEALNALGVIETHAFRLEDGRIALEESARLNDELGRRFRRSVNLSNLAIAFYKLGYLERAHQMLDEAEALGDPDERVLERQLKRLVRAKIMLLQDRSEEAQKIAEDVERIARHRGYLREQSLALEVRGVAARKRGELTPAWRLLSEALGVVERIAPYGDMVAGLQRRLGQIAMMRGDAAVAEARLRLSVRLSNRCCERYELIAAYRLLAELYRTQRRYDTAYTMIRQALATGREFGVVLAHGWSLFEAARIQGAWFHAIGMGTNGANEGLWEPLRPSAVAEPQPADGNQASNEVRGLVKGHLEAAWSYVVDALHLFEQVGCATGQHASERLMAELRDHWQPPWASSPAALQREQDDSEGFVARAPASVRVRRLLDLAADSDDPVLLTGPTGTGKELAVQRIHTRGKRATGPLVAVNCGAIPELVFEREFFGHAQSAFTGAESAAPGFCERADGGTLFLDEVGELPAGLQVKLLRILQEGTYQRLGDPVERRVDIRIIAATNSDLLDAMARGDFRSDLYYRLQFLEVRMSPLRARREDIIPLANLFARRATGKDLSLVDLCESGVIDALVKYDWPGNVRELEGLVRRLCLLIRRGGRVSLAMLPSEMKPERGRDSEITVATARTDDSRVPDTGVRIGVVDEARDSDFVGLATALTQSGSGVDLATWLRAAEVLAIRRALTAATGRKTEAARMLGISRNTLYKKLGRLGLREC